MRTDVLFIDMACAKPYNFDSLENDLLGGTEQSTIRLAEGFASKGLKVAVIQKYDFPATDSPNGVTYAPISWINQIKAKNVIHLRFRGLIERYQDSRQFVWMHDASYEHHNNPAGWDEPMIKYGVTGVCVSDWHRKNILQLCPGMPLVRVYSPVDELCYTHPRATMVDTNQLVWMSSPHKGLKEAIEVFDQLYQQDKKFKLAVFNPGYYFEEIKEHPGIAVLPKCKRNAVRSVVSQSLCLFYPTLFEETFGLVAAEANALGTPVMSYGVAALAESAIDKPLDSSESIINMVLGYRDARPKVDGQERFRFNEVWNDWSKLLDI